MKILLVDDSSEFQDVFVNRFKDDHDVIVTSTVASAVQYLQKSQFDLVIVDWMLPFQNGRVLLDWVNLNKPDQKLWVNTDLQKSVIKKFTNGNRVFTKGLDSVVDAVNEFNS